MTAQITALVARINRVESCEELQRLTVRALGDLTKLSASLQHQLDTIAPFLALLSLNPADLPGVIEFLGKLKDLLTAQLGPYATLIAQAAALPADIALVTGALADAASRIGSCSLTIPSVPGIVVPTP